MTTKELDRRFSGLKMRWAGVTLEQRFWTKVNKNGPINYALGSRCWEWPAYFRDRGIDFVEGERTPLPWSPLQGKGAYCDDKTYPYAKAKAA